MHLLIRRSVFLGVLSLSACAARVAEQGPPPGTTEQSSVCSSGKRPAPPAAPTTACLEESLGEDGSVVSTTRRTIALVDGVNVVREETFGGAGLLSLRVVRRSRGDRVLFESTEHPLLSATDSLPYTYGEAATFSIEYGYDTAGRLVRKAYDRAMDGKVDTEELTSYHPTGVVRERTMLSDGKLARVESFDAAGNPLSDLDSGDNGRRWTYDKAGVLTLEEQLTAGSVVLRSVWTMRAKGDPLRRATSKVSMTGAETRVAEETWTYDASGRLAAVDAWEIITGARRVKHTDFDARRRPTLFVEENDEPSCRRYEQRSEYGADEHPIQQTTTCDGRPFERLRTTFDASARKVRVERGFYGNPRATTEDVTTYAYDACGRLATSEQTHNGSLQRRENYAFDELGRMTRLEVLDRTGALGASTITYDDRGRVVVMDGKRWTYDDEGRITSIEFDGGLIASREKRIRVTTMRFRHACGS